MGRLESIRRKLASVFSIITTDANELAARVHSRMPAILHPKDYDRWLERDSERAPVDVLRPFEAEAMAAAPCNPKVGNAEAQLTEEQYARLR